MAKRMTVRFIGGMHYVHMQAIPVGTEFKAVDAMLPGKLKGVYIRGTSLTKATKGKHKFKAKQYLFIVEGEFDAKRQMEVVHAN